ncbi:hypothetical protein Zm00014a_008797 [Zea mays]|uniref:Uncharacterized protein n=1 Tax=Zea mays TaxID=4577 RepID=A0A3L6EQP5_MAIZE|nr:hypothetical protein Zm00014a_008797 [Zea mays]
MDIKSMGETIDSTEGTLKIPEDQVLVEAPSDVQLPPEHNLNGEASSLNGHTDKEEKVSVEQPHDNDQEEAELDQNNRINKEDAADGLSHGESTTEDSCLLKHKKDEESKGDEQQDLGVTVDDDLVQEDTLKTDNAIEQTDDGQQDQDQEPEKANENTEPASIANNDDVEIVAETPTGLQAPVESRMNDSDGIPETIDEETETDEPAQADGVVHPEDVAKVEDQQSQQDDTVDADVAPEEVKCEETDQQEEKPKSEAHEPTIDTREALNQEPAEETDDSMNKKIEETAHQRNMAAPKETTLEHEATMSATPVNTQVQDQEPLEEIEDTEKGIQPSSGSGDAIPEDQSNLGVTIDNDTVNEDTVIGIEQQDDGQQDEDLEPEKATEDTQPASMTNIPQVEVVTEASSGVQTPGDLNLNNSDAVPDTIDANTETDEPSKAHSVVHPEKKERFLEDATTEEPTEEVVKVEAQQSQQADVMDANMVQEEVPKSEHADEPATDAFEVLNQESVDEPAIQAPVTIQVQNQEPLEEIELAEAVDTEATVQQSSAAFEESVPEHQCNLGATHNTEQEDTLEASGQSKGGQEYQDLGPENATENTQQASMTNILDVEVITETPSGIQTPMEINLVISDAIPDATDGNTETDEPAKAHTFVHPEKNEVFPENTFTTKPTAEVVKVEDQQNQQDDAMDAEVVLEEVPKSERADEPATDALEVLESVEETDDPMNEKTEETTQQSNIPASEETTAEYDATREPPANNQVQNKEPVDERESTVEEREVAEAVDTEAPVQQSSVAFDEAVPEEHHNLGVANNTVQEDTMEATGQTQEGQQYQDLGPENAAENTQPASTENIPDVEVITKAPSEIQSPVEINLDISDAIPDTNDGNTETDEPAKANTVARPDTEESFAEDTSTGPTEEVVTLEDQQSQQVDAKDADVVQEEVPTSEHTDEPATDAVEALNQESDEETDGPVYENTEETTHQSNMPASEETLPENDVTTREPSVTIQAQNQESLEEREVHEAVDTEATVQPSSASFEESVPEHQHNLGATNDTVQQDTLEATKQTKGGQQYQDLGPENATENTQPASMANIPDVDVITKASSGIQTPVEINRDISDAIPDATDGSTETTEPAKAHSIIHPEKKESFQEDTSTAEPTEEVIKVEDRQSQQAEAMDADVVQEDVPKSEHADEPTADALEVLNQESIEETNSPVNEETEEATNQSNMPASEETIPKYDAATRDQPVNIQAQNQEPVDEGEATVEEREVAEAVHTEAPVQQSSVAFEEAVPEDQHNLGVANNTVQEDMMEATGQTKEGQRYQDLGPENAIENTQPASTANIPEVEVITEAPSGFQTPVEINLDISDAIADTTDGNTGTDELVKAEGVIHPENKESFLEDTSTTEPLEEVANVEDQHNQQADAMDADVVQEEVPKSKADEPATDTLEVLNQEYAEETSGPANEKIEETANQSNMLTSEETVPEYDTATRDPPVNIQAQNQESLEEREATVAENEVAEAVDTEAPVQQSSVALEDAVPEDQHNLGATNNTAQEDTQDAIGQTKEGQQFHDLGPENATENTQPASMANIADVDVTTEAPSGIQTPVEINLDISDAIPDTTDGNTETDKLVKTEGVIHPEKKESFPEDTSTAEPTEEVANVEDQQSQRADAMDADVVDEEVPKSEHADEPATDALEVLNQDYAEETNDPVNEKTEETGNQSNMPPSEETTPEYDTTTREPPVNIQAQNQESLEEREATVEESEVAEAVDTEAPVQQSSVALEDAVPEDQYNLIATNNTVQEDTQEAIGQTKEGQQYHDLGPENATENTEPASTANTPDVDVITEAPSGIQTSIEINLDISDAIPDTTDGNAKTDELVKVDGVILPDHKESFSEDTCVVEPTEEMIEVDQLGQQADAIHAEVLQEEVPEMIEVDQLGQQADVIHAEVLQEEVHKSEQSDEPGVDAQEVLNQESAEETDGLVNVKTDETEHKSNMVVPDDTIPEHDAQTREPPVNIQEQSRESVGDAEAVNTEAEMQQNSVAFEETTPENHVATSEPCSEIQHAHHVEPEEINGPEDGKDDEITNMSSREYLVRDNVLQSGPIIDIQPVQELEQIKTDEASNQTHAVIFNDLAQEDATATSEPQVTETELKDIEATEAEEITKLDHVTHSKELAVENDSTADEPHKGEIHQTLEQDLVEVKDTGTYHEKTISTSEDTVQDNLTEDEPSFGSQEVDDAESTEETKQNIAENIAEVSDVAIVDDAIEQNVLQTEDIVEMHKQELEREETERIEPVESEEASDQRNDAPFDYSAREDNTKESEIQQTESATETNEIEPTEIEAVPRESNTCVSEEPSQEDHIKESETSFDNQEVNITESSEVNDSHKDIISGGISDPSNTASAGDSSEGSNVPEGEPPEQAVQELGSEEIKNTQIDEVNETSLEMNATVFQIPSQEENPDTTKLHESTEVSNIEATEMHGNPHQSDLAAQSEEQTTEGISSGLKPESIEGNDTEAKKCQSTSQEKTISASESVPEDATTEPDVDHQQLQDQESAKLKETEADKFQEIVSSNTLSSEEFTSTEPSSDTEADNSQLAEETEDTEIVKSNTALAEAAAPETDATADTSSFHETDLEENKDTGTIETEDGMVSSDYTSEKMDMETMETEAVPHDSSDANIKEHTEDDTSTPNAPHAGTEPVHELESVEVSADTTEHPGETHDSASDELTPTEENTAVTEPSFSTQEVQNLTSQEIKDSEDDKTDEFSDINSFPIPGEADQVPRSETTPDVQEVEELGLTEETRDIEAIEPGDQQEDIVSTLEKPEIDGEPSADNQQVHEDKLPEVEDNKAIEAEASKQSNIATPDNAAEERNELESDPDPYAQPAEQVELSKDNENSQLVKTEETSDQSNFVVLRRTTEDSVAREIDPPVAIKQEQPVEEIKGVDATEAEEDFRTTQAVAIEKLASVNKIATVEPTYDIQRMDDLEATEEKKHAEAINEGDQSNIAVSEEQTPTYNGETPEDHHVESNEGTMGNETDNIILAHGIKDEIQKSAELKDGPCDLSETVLTTRRSENMIDEDNVQTYGNDTVEASNSIHQVKEEPDAGTEHNSSQMISECSGENETHVQDRDVDMWILTEGVIAEASQALLENDPQAAQDTIEKDDTTKSSEPISDHDSRQHCDVEALQQQSCETEALSILEQDEALQKIDSDQKQKEVEEIESQNDELQVDEQKHEDKRDDLAKEPLVEYQNFENRASNNTKDNDAFKVEQTEAANSEILKNKALHISKESTPSIMAMKVENIKETSEGTEEDDAAKNDNKDEQENAENVDIVSKTSTNEQGQTTDEIRKEEDPVHIIQASEKEIADEIEESKEIHEDNAICHDKLQTNSEKEESPQPHSNEPYNVDAKIDDTTSLCEEIIHDNTSINPREIEEIGENKGPDFTSEPSVESSIQNNVEDSSSHHKVEDEKLSMSEKNDVDTEAMQEINDESGADINQTEQCQEEITADDVLQLETEGNSFDKIEETASNEETETSTAATEAVTFNEDITDKVSGADGAPSNGSLKTFTDTGRDIDVPLVITTSKEESVNDTMENLNLDLPGHQAQDGNTAEKVLSLEEREREMPSSEKLLQTEPGENQIPNEQDEKDIRDENQTLKEKDEDDMQDTEFGEAKKEVQQELPVSHFLMNLILGKESSDANEDSESEAARKQGEATEDDSCTFISEQEESLGSLPTENKVDDNPTFVEQEKHEVKCSEETQEMVEEQSDDQLHTERSIEIDEDIKKNTRALEIPAYQDNPQDGISGELQTEEAAGVSTKMVTRDIDISSVVLDNRTVGTVCQEKMEVSTKNENGSLRSSLNDSTNTMAPQDDTLGEGQSRLVLEPLPEDKSVDVVSEQAPLLTESGMTDANDLSSDTTSAQNPVSTKPTESARVEATYSTDIQLENEEVDKKEEDQHANTTKDEVSKEIVESSHINLQKITRPEEKSNELETQITEPVCDSQAILAHEKEISEENFPTAVEIQADGPNMQINQDKQDEAADIETEMKPEKLGESNFQEHQDNGTEQKSPKETDEGDQQLVAKKEILTQEMDVHETVERPQQAVESPQQTVSITSNEDQELFDSKVQERDLNVVSPREASEAEENFVDVTKPEFSTDEEQSPKADAEEKIYDEKIKDIEGTKNLTDEAAIKTEAPGAAQKTRKKYSLLSGVGSKVKHQLAKVKKAIVGKPGHTKPVSPTA